MAKFVASEIRIPLVPVQRRIEAYEMDVGDNNTGKAFISTLLDKFRFVGEEKKTDNSEYVTIRTAVPHGIRVSGTKVVLENFGPSSGVRIVYVEDEKTLVMKRRAGEESQPVPSARARLYVPYTNSTGMIKYTQGIDGRPAKNQRECARREAYDQCEKMPNLNERSYTMLPKKCTNRVEGPACVRDSVCRKHFKDQGYKTYNRAKCEGENLRKGIKGTCALYETTSCGYARHFAGVGPSDRGTSYITRALTSTADLIEENRQCRSSTCVIPGSGDIVTEGGLEFCNQSKANCETCRREGSDQTGKWTNKPLSQANSVQECAEACALDVGCKFFLYDRANGTCFAENTDSRECIEGFESAPGVDMYELVLAEKDVGCSRYGATCCPEAHVRAKGDPNVKCAFQEPMPDGSKKLNLVNPGDKLSTMCETHAVQTLKTNAQLRTAAKEEEGEFLDMQNKNSHIKIQLAKNRDMREELDNGCCDANGENCGCPYISDYPVYYQAYEDSEEDAVPAAARLTFPIPGCDAWNNLEEEIKKGNLNGGADVETTLRNKGVPRADIDDFTGKYRSNLVHGSYRLACEAGWKTRKCEQYVNNPMELSACRSGAYLRTVGAPLDYERGRTLDVATMESRTYLESMGETCVTNAPAGSAGACPGKCVSDGTEKHRCMQCVNDDTCATKFGREYVCAPYADVGREIMYDGDLSSNPHLKHSFLFKTCQRKDEADAARAYLDGAAFATSQKLQDARMKAAASRAKIVSGLTLLILVAAGVYMMRQQKQ